MDVAEPMKLLSSFFTSFEMELATSDDESMFELPPKFTDTVGSALAKLDKDSSLVFVFVLETDGVEEDRESRDNDFRGEDKEELLEGTDVEESGEDDDVSRFDTEDPPEVLPLAEGGGAVKLCKSSVLISSEDVPPIFFELGDRMLDTDDNGLVPPRVILF